jgi:hypothetical protein
MSDSNGDPTPHLQGLSKNSIVPAISNSLEVLANLVYLTEHEANHPLKVCEYMKMADAQLQVLYAIVKRLKSN